MATIFTIGHGARSASDFVSRLREASITRLVDVRAFPASRRNPQFARESLGPTLEQAGIRYDWRGKALGGFRKGGEQSRHSALKHPMFRAYAEHMEAGSFVAAANDLANLGETERVCIMCAERDPAHCHRSLIADWLTTRGHRVMHLLEPGVEREHVLNPDLHVDQGRLLYLGRQKDLL
jgi:uncharacterized protein (DUF488 family)